MSDSHLTVAELIAKLQTFPQDLPVYKRTGGGCNECNEDGMDYYDALDKWSVSLDENCPGEGYRKDVLRAVVI